MSISKKKTVSVSKVDRHRRVVVPKSICERLGLHEGEFVEMTLQRGAALLKPKPLETDEALTAEEEKAVRKGERQLKQGKFILWDDLKTKLKL